MILTQSDYRKIANEVLHKENCGYSEFEVIKDNEVMCIGFTYDVDGYTEEETNGYVVTDVSFSAEVVFCANDDEEDTDHNFNENEIYKLIA